MEWKEEKFTRSSETERLIIRSLQKGDYENWLHEFEQRSPSQNRHDQGQIDMRECSLEWFCHLVERQQQLALTDTAYIFGVFKKEEGTHVGMVDFSTLARDEFQMKQVIPF